MELATIDPSSHKVQTKLYKITKFVVTGAIVSKIQPLENAKIGLNTASGWPYISLLIGHF